MSNTVPVIARGPAPNATDPWKSFEGEGVGDVGVMGSGWARAWLQIHLQIESNHTQSAAAGPHANSPPNRT